MPVIVGCFAPQEAELIAFARAAHDRGASAMMLTPPPFYKVTAFHFQRLLERITASCDIPWSSTTPPSVRACASPPARSAVSSATYPPSSA